MQSRDDKLARTILEYVRLLRCGKEDRPDVVAAKKTLVAEMSRVKAARKKKP